MTPIPIANRIKYTPINIENAFLIDEEAQFSHPYINNQITTTTFNLICIKVLIFEIIIFIIIFMIFMIIIYNEQK